uniref:Uncharacterized protein n=1 Tax=Knipowitschia caucasica TaxID=637954 RepID=A0AAV2LST0_KNICA
MRTMITLLIILPLLTGVCAEQVFVRDGGLVVLKCPKGRRMTTSPSWTSYTPQKRILMSETNTAAPLLLHQRSLVLLRVSPNQQGNYSCSVGNNTFWHQLVVLTAESHAHHTGAQYTATCYSGERCTLRCPVSNCPGSDIPHLKRHGITWTKGGQTQVKEVLSFSKVEEADEGTYTCSRFYGYKDQTYNRTVTYRLDVKPQETPTVVEILTPRHREVFEIKLGSVYVVNCTATLSSDFDEVFWMSQKSSVKSDPNLRMHSRSAVFQNTKGTYMTTALVFTEVTEEDLSKEFTCKLESVSAPSSSVTVSLQQKQQEAAHIRTVIIVTTLLATAAAALTGAMLKSLLNCDMMLNVLLFLTASIGVSAERICVRSGEMVALQCPRRSVMQRGPDQSENTTLLTDRELVLLNASEHQQGNYSCIGAHNKTYDLTVYTSPTGDCEKFSQFPKTCYSGQACSLSCPASYTPARSVELILKGVTWQGEGLKGWVKEKTLDFPRVTESDGGAYTCVRSFLFRGQVYNMTFNVTLDIQPKETIKNEGIISPSPNEVFSADVGSPLVINCTAMIFSILNEVYWKIDQDNVRVHSSVTKEDMGEGTKMTASLFFEEVSEKDLSTVFTCRLESVSQPSISVNVTLAQKERPSYVAVTVTAVVIPALMVASILIYMKYKIHITLFLRDGLGCHRRVSDDKSFDAFILYYWSEQEPGLSADQRRTLQNVLEDRFGYSLCLFDRDVLPGKAVADALLECVEQSRVVLLVPSSPDFCSESALLSALHETLVERQTRLLFITNKGIKKSGIGPLLDTVQLLAELGQCVPWAGSLENTSFFWKQLRYHLPPNPEQTIHYRAIRGEVFMMPCDSWSRVGDQRKENHSSSALFKAEASLSGTYTCLTSAGWRLLHLQVVNNTIGCSSAEESTLTLEIGAGGKITCPGYNCSNSTTTVWYKGNKSVSKTRRRVFFKDGHLQLYEVSKYDNAVFFCDRELQEQGANWTLRRSVRVKALNMVKSPPRILRPANNTTQEVELGLNHTLQCEVYFPEADPPGVLQWFRNDNGHLQNVTMENIEVNQVEWELQLILKSHWTFDEKDLGHKDFDVLLSYVSMELSSPLRRNNDNDAFPFSLEPLDVEVPSERLELLLPHVLEEQWGYRLCLMDRDFLPGGAYTKDVVNGLQRSQMLICLLSAEYFSNNNAVFVLESGLQALLENSGLKLQLIWTNRAPVSLPQLNPPLPVIIQKALKVLPALKWTPSANTNFWRSLRKAMPHQRLSSLQK